jgi:hypothetical protein
MVPVLEQAAYRTGHIIAQENTEICSFTEKLTKAAANSFGTNIHSVVVLSLKTPCLPMDINDSQIYRIEEFWSLYICTVCDA